MTSDGYSPGHRALEVAGIIVFAALALYLCAQLASIGRPGIRWLIAGAALAGYVAADLVSGIVHWVCDTWGTIDTPLVGRHFIRPFREHHTDPMGITRHDFIETNGNNCIAASTALGPACIVSTETAAGVFVAAFILSLSLAVFATNQFHKWAHEDDPGRVVRWLQRQHLILPPGHHGIHHCAPYATHYCITTGWLNPALRAIDFHRRAERFIAAVTGAVRPSRSL